MGVVEKRGGRGVVCFFLSRLISASKHIGSVGCLSQGHDFMKELVNTTLEDHHQCMRGLSGA